MLNEMISLPVVLGEDDRSSAEHQWLEALEPRRMFAATSMGADAPMAAVEMALHHDYPAPVASNPKTGTPFHWNGTAASMVAPVVVAARPAAVATRVSFSGTRIVA